MFRALPPLYRERWRMKDETARDFLLGKMSDAERERTEILFLTDDEARNTILLAEEDLIEGYLEHSLTPWERKRFVEKHLQTPAQQRRLRLTSLLFEMSQKPIKWKRGDKRGK